MLLAGVLAVCIGYLPYEVYGPVGVRRTLRLEQDLTQMQDSNQQMQHENQVLREQIRHLKQDRSTIERVARDELGMVRPSDIVLQFQR